MDAKRHVQACNLQVLNLNIPVLIEIEPPLNGNQFVSVTVPTTKDTYPVKVYAVPNC